MTPAFSTLVDDAAHIAAAATGFNFAKTGNPASLAAEINSLGFCFVR
jgi:hypothetical protein